MKHEARVAALDGLIAVKWIADNGVGYAIEMNADLMPTAGVRADIKESEHLQSFQDTKLRKAGFATLDIDGHAAGTELPQWSVDLTLVVADNTMDKSQVRLLNRAGFKLLVELPVGLRIAGKDDHTAGFPVDTMDDIELLPSLGTEHLKKRPVQPPAFRDGH